MNRGLRSGTERVEGLRSGKEQSHDSPESLGSARYASHKGGRLPMGRCSYIPGDGHIVVNGTEGRLMGNRMEGVDRNLLNDTSLI